MPVGAVIIFQVIGSVFNLVRFFIKITASEKGYYYAWATRASIASMAGHVFLQASCQLAKGHACFTSPSGP